MNKIELSDSILSSHDLFELADAIDSFIGAIDGKSNKYSLIKDLYKQLRDHVASSMIVVFRPYSIHSGSESLCQFLYGHWVLQKGYEKNVECLSRISNLIRSEYLSPERPLISTNQIHMIMNLANARYNFFQDVLKDNHLPIYLVNNSHISRNAQHELRMTEDNHLRHAIIMYSPKENVRRTVTYTFAHELGHVVQTELNGEMDDTPYPFNLLANNNIGPVGPLEMSELISDWFADSLNAQKMVIDMDHMENNHPDVIKYMCFCCLIKQIKARQAG